MDSTLHYFREIQRFIQTPNILPQNGTNLKLELAAKNMQKFKIIEHCKSLNVVNIQHLEISCLTMHERYIKHIFSFYKTA